MSETIKLSYVSVRDYEGKENVRYILLWKIGDLVCYSKGENVFTVKGESSMKKVVLLIVEKLRGHRIFYRLLMMFIFATLLPITFFSIWSYRKNSQVIREKVYDSVNAVLDQFSNQINQKIEKIRNDSIEISYMSEIQDAVMNYKGYNNRELNKLKINVTKEMSTKYAFDNIVAGITLYTLEGEKINVYGESVYTINLSETDLEEFLPYLQEKGGKCVFRSVNEKDQEALANLKREAIIVGKAIKQSNTGNTIGYMLLQINENNFSDIYAGMNKNMNARAFILDSEGTVISTVGDYADIGELYPDEKIREQLLKANLELKEQQKLDREDIVLMGRKMSKNDWKLFFLIPNSYLQTGLSGALLNFIAISVICISIGIIVTFIFSYSIILPLNEVNKGLQQFEEGNLSISLSEKAHDEITALSIQFNHMAKKINRLLDKVKNDEKQKRKLEIQALQAQINPHFLANTLNTAAYIARMKREETIEILLNAIIELLRNSMKNDDSMHLIKNEMELIKQYITIQDYRLLGKFTVNIQIDPEIEKYSIPRFILQPVVENAIIHGVEPLDRRGAISIRGYLQDEKILFVITDNGVGMEKEQVEKMLNNRCNIEKGRFSGVGIGNVNSRMQLIFGEQYGLTIKSEKNMFTSVVISFPKVQSGEDNCE